MQTIQQTRVPFVSGSEKLQTRGRKRVSKEERKRAPFEPSTYHILPLHSLACPHDYCTMNDVVSISIKLFKLYRKHHLVELIHVRAYALTHGYDEVAIRVIDFNL